MEHYCSWSCCTEVLGMDPVDYAKTADSRHLIGTSDSLPEGGRIHAKFEVREMPAIRFLWLLCPQGTNNSISAG
jgi:hypothetical protein